MNSIKKKIKNEEKCKLVVYVDVLLQNILKEDTNKQLSILSL